MKETIQLPNPVHRARKLRDRVSELRIPEDRLIDKVVEKLTPLVGRLVAEKVNGIRLPSPPPDPMAADAMDEVSELRRRVNELEEEFRHTVHQLQETVGNNESIDVQAFKDHVEHFADSLGDALDAVHSALGESGANLSSAAESLSEAQRAASDLYGNL